MRAHQIMTREVIATTPEASILEAANTMLQHHVSGLPVLDGAKKLVGIVSEGDFLRRAEIGTGRKPSRWLQFFTGPGRAGADFVHERGRKVGEVMTRDPIAISEDTPLDEIVDLMERHDVKRLPVLRAGKLVGIVSRGDLLRTVASMAREIPDPTADDQHIRDRILTAVGATVWRPAGFAVSVRKGVVHLHGVVFDDGVRQAAIVAAENTAGVKEVHDHMCWVDGYSGFYLESEEDRKAAS